MDTHTHLPGEATEIRIVIRFGRYAQASEFGFVQGDYGYAALVLHSVLVIIQSEHRHRADFTFLRFRQGEIIVEHLVNHKPEIIESVYSNTDTSGIVNNIHFVTLLEYPGEDIIINGVVVKDIRYGSGNRNFLSDFKFLPFIFAGLPNKSSTTPPNKQHPGVDFKPRLIAPYFYELLHA